MNYQLHDFEIDSVVLENDSIIFSFPNGFHVVDENGQEVEPLRKKLVFRIDTAGSPVESSVWIRRVTRWKGWRDISFQQFTDLFQKGNMTIHDEYDSKYTNWKMIQLNAAASCSNIEMFIADILEVECL